MSERMVVYHMAQLSEINTKIIKGPGMSYMNIKNFKDIDEVIRALNIAFNEGYNYHVKKVKEVLETY